MEKILKIPSTTLNRFIQLYIRDVPCFYSGHMGKKDYELLGDVLKEYDIRSKEIRKKTEIIPHLKGDDYHLVGEGEIYRPVNERSKLILSSVKRSYYNLQIARDHLSHFSDDLKKLGLEVKIK